MVLESGHLLDHGMEAWLILNCCYLDVCEGQTRHSFLLSVQTDPAEPSRSGNEDRLPRIALVPDFGFHEQQQRGSHTDTESTGPSAEAEAHGFLHQRDLHTESQAQLLGGSRGGAGFWVRSTIPWEHVQRLGTRLYPSVLCSPTRAQLALGTLLTLVLFLGRYSWSIHCSASKHLLNPCAPHSCHSAVLSLSCLSVWRSLSIVPRKRPPVSQCRNLESEF